MTIETDRLILELQGVRDFLVGLRPGATRQQVIEEVENALTEAREADHDS